jgi:hypothetical protein
LLGPVFLLFPFLPPFLITDSRQVIQPWGKLMSLMRWPQCHHHQYSIIAVPFLSGCSRHTHTKGKWCTGKQTPINSFHSKLEHDHHPWDVNPWPFPSLVRGMGTKPTRLLLFTILTHTLYW